LPEDQSPGAAAANDKKKEGDGKDEGKGG